MQPPEQSASFLPGKPSVRVGRLALRVALIFLDVLAQFHDGDRPGMIATIPIKVYWFAGVKIRPR